MWRPPRATHFPYAALFRSGAATNPEPEVFAGAATQVVHAMNATHKLGGQNYVLWGGREGYETLLNTDLRKEREQVGKFMQLDVKTKHNISFNVMLLYEHKPQEKNKKQFYYDVTTLYRFLKQFCLLKQYKVKIKAIHATYADIYFQH